MKSLLLIISLALTSVHAKTATVEQLFNVQTVKVKQETTTKSIKSFGFVQVDQSRVYDVAPRFGGFIEILFADKIYKKVSKGEKLLKVYSPEVLKAKDEYINSLRYSKNKTMIHASMAKLQLLNVPQNEIESIQQERDSTTILSPANGYIFKKNVNNNSAFNAKKVIFEIVNLDNVWVEVNVHQNQLQALKGIDTFVLSTPALKETFKVKNFRVYPKLNPKEESFTLRLEVKNMKHLLKPGMYMNVAMNQVSKDYLTLPTTAVIRKNGMYYAFVIGDYEGEYEPLEVQVEMLNPNTYIIKSGLNAGDEVVNNALFMMDSDAQINGLY